MTELTILVPTHNSRANIDALCAGLQCQNEPDFKLIFIDNASTDGTMELLQRYAVFDRRIQVMSVSEPLSLMKCYDMGLKKVQTPYTALLNGTQKIYLSQYYVSRMLGSIRKFKSDFVYVYEVKLLGENKQLTHPMQPSTEEFLKRHNSLLFSADRIDPELLFSFNIEPWNKLYRTEFLKNIPSQDAAEPYFLECILAAQNISYLGVELCFRNIFTTDLYNPEVCKIAESEEQLLYKYGKFEKFKNAFIQYKMRNLLQTLEYTPPADKQKIFNRIKNCVLNEDFSRYNAGVLATSQEYHYLQRLSVSNYENFVMFEERRNV